MKELIAAFLIAIIMTLLFAGTRNDDNDHLTGAGGNA